MSQGPFTYDIVGSFLRPATLKKAREEFTAGKINKTALRQVEDEAIKDLVEKEKALGLQAVTDGEFRRSFWHIDFLEELIGVERVKADSWSVEFKDHSPKALTLHITSRLDFPKNHPFLEDFKYTKSVAGDTLVKQTIPSPSMLPLIVAVRGVEDYQPIPEYKDINRLYDDLVITYQKAIKAFYDAGCRYLQLDDTSWGEFCDVEKVKAYEAQGLDIPAIEEKFVEVINRILETKPEDMTITMHICRGNFRSTWFSSGGYDPVAPILFSKCHIDAFFLEYDSDRSGGFEPLQYITNQKVVLGLITSKSPELEDPTQVKARIQEATKYLAKKQLALSPQCGFSSTEEGNELTENDQWEKIKLVKAIAEEVF